MTSIARLVVVVVVVVVAIALAANGRVLDENTETAATRYLRRYGYLKEFAHTASSENVEHGMRHAIGLFQEYYRLPHDSELNEETLRQMRKPRCGVRDISDHTIGQATQRWPRTHLTWNFHLASSEHFLTLTQRAFDLWAANSSLTFERDTVNPDIIISFQMGPHANINTEKNGLICDQSFDGPGSILAHATLPGGWNDFVSEIHVDQTEPWHIFVNAHPPQTVSLLQTLTHEIGHSLGLSHNQRNDSIMFAYSPINPIPVLLSKEDVNEIRLLYDDNGGNNDEPTAPAATPAATPAIPVSTDLCALRQIDVMLIMNRRMYIAHDRHVWSVDIHGKTYDDPLLLTNYMKFIPRNFTRLRGAYQNPSGEILLFVDSEVYKVRYPTFELVPTWPRTLEVFGLPPDARINAAVNTNTGRSFVIYNDRVIGEIDECHGVVTRHHNIETVFPGIPPNVKSVFRYLDGHLYFISNRQFYKFNEYTETVIEVGDFDLRIINIVCPRDGLLQQLRDLLDRLVRINTDKENRPEENI